MVNAQARGAHPDAGFDRSEGLKLCVVGSIEIQKPFMRHVIIHCHASNITRSLLKEIAEAEEFTHGLCSRSGIASVVEAVRQRSGYAIAEKECRELFYYLWRRRIDDQALDDVRRPRVDRSQMTLHGV
jgi:hypothetical protein